MHLSVIELAFKLFSVLFEKDYDTGIGPILLFIKIKNYLNQDKFRLLMPNLNICLAGPVIINRL